MIPDAELYVEVLDPKAKGGQHVTITASEVRVTHLPTGISATVDARSQHRSRKVAIEMLEAALTSPNLLS